MKAPLDHDRPRGRQITLALYRIPHTSSAFQGPLLVHPGGPSSGRNLTSFVASALPADLAAQYDVVGFDVRGVGSSDPALDCEPGYFNAVPRPDSVPHNAREEHANLERARSSAKACGSKYADLLPYINTISVAKDLDVIRAALGAEKINYLGYSTGTYFGAVYARLFPQRVRRLPRADRHPGRQAPHRRFRCRRTCRAAPPVDHPASHMPRAPAESGGPWITRTAGRRGPRWSS